MSNIGKFDVESPSGAIVLWLIASVTLSDLSGSGALATVGPHRDCSGTPAKEQGTPC